VIQRPCVAGTSSTCTSSAGADSPTSTSRTTADARPATKQQGGPSSSPGDLTPTARELTGIGEARDLPYFWVAGRRDGFPQDPAPGVPCRTPRGRKGAPMPAERSEAPGASSRRRQSSRGSAATPRASDPQDRCSLDSCGHRSMTGACGAAAPIPPNSARLPVTPPMWPCAPHLARLDGASGTFPRGPDHPACGRTPARLPPGPQRSPGGAPTHRQA
jgi:hypothetical protein